jgi:uncharacterized membrane protein YkvA (DUF1232 family)
MDVCLQIRQKQSQLAFVETLKTPVRRFLQHFRVVRRALWHPLVPWYAKLVAGFVVGYVFSPIQLIPNFIPIIGQLDDVLVVSMGIRLLRRWVPRLVLEDCQKCTKQNSLHKCDWPRS